MLFALICALLGPTVITPSAPGDFTVDAFFNDWQGQARFTIEEVRSGSVTEPTDFYGVARLGFDEKAIYLAFDITDDRFVPGGADEGDRVFVRFSEDEDSPTIQVILNTLELRPPTVAIDGVHCAECKGAGTMRRDGWAVEVAIPHNRVPDLAVGTRSLIVTMHDTDLPGDVADATISTGTQRTRGDAFELDPVADARAVYLEAKRTETPVIGRHRANIWGNVLTEEVHINGRDVVLLGRDLPDGSAYLYFTHEWRSEAQIARIKTMELDGRPGKEILVYRVVKPRAGETHVEVLDIFGVYKGNLRRRFSQVVGVRFGEDRRASSAVTFKKKGRRPATIVVEPATMEGVDKSTFRDPDPRGTVNARAMPLPWADKQIRHRLRGAQWGR